MGEQQQQQRPRGRDGRFLPAAGAAVKVRTRDGRTRTYRAVDGPAAKIAEQVKQARTA